MRGVRRRPGLPARPPTAEPIELLEIVETPLPWAYPDGPPPPQWAAPPPAQSAQSAQSAAFRRRRRVLITAGGLAAVVVAGAVVAYLRPGHATTSLTFNGEKITNAKATLARAEATVARMVSARQGTAATDSRCYYAVPNQPQPGAKPSDIDRILWCGPVLFIADDPAATYLDFTLAATPTTAGFALTVPASPQTSTPSAAPTGVHFVRPDGRKPAGLSTLRPPPTPAAPPDTFARANLSGADLPLAPDGSAIGSLDGGIALYALGQPPSYGSGDGTRVPAPGQKFIAFRTSPAVGNSGAESDLSAKAVVSVDHGPGRPLPAGTGANYVLAVPKSATAVDLVLDDSGWHQSLSLLDGTPGAGNIAVLARPNRGGSSTNGTIFPVTEAFSPAVQFSDGATLTRDSGTITVQRMALDYQQTVGATTFTASSPKAALMFLDIRQQLSHDSAPGPVESALMTFTPTGGAPIQVKNLDPEPDYIFSSVDVPAGVTTGTLTISGRTTVPFTGSSHTYTITIDPPISIAVSFPIIG